MARFSFALGQFHRDAAAPQIARQHGRMAQRRLAQRGDEEIQRLGGFGCPPPLITSLSSPMEKPMPGECTFEPSDSASPS